VAVFASKGARARFLVSSLLSLQLGGCLARQTTEQHEIGPVDSSEIESGSLTCAAGSPRAIALLEPPAGGSGCGTVLELGDTGELSVVRRLRANELAVPEVLARGPAPEICGSDLGNCEVSGHADKLGPIVLVQVHGPESEVPIQVYLGWIEGERLLFVESWYGLPSVVDHTRIGPPWALAAFDCAGERLLLPAPRLPEAEHESPPAVLRELSGRWWVDADGIAQPPKKPSTIDAASCRAMLPDLP
jgi:hypothetical protein